MKVVKYMMVAMNLVKKNCGCNQILIDYIDRNIYRMTGGQRQMAKVVRSYFAFENWKDGC